MKFSKAQSNFFSGWKTKASLLVCCLSILCTLAATTNVGSVYASGSTAATLYAVSPTDQSLSLASPSVAAPGGRGYMTPQTVIAKDSSGNPLPGIPVTFEVPANGYLTCVMRGYNKNTITVTTDSNGIASAANTHQSFLGEGFQVYSQYPAITHTLQVKATSPGSNTVSFNVNVATVIPGTTPVDPPTNKILSSLSPIDQNLSLASPSVAAPGGRGYMTPQTVIAKDSAGNPLPGVPVTFEVPANGYLTCVMRGYNKNTITVTTDSNGMASAANTHQDFLGEGFQVYSQYPAITQTLQVKATAPGANTVSFNVKVATVIPGTTPVDPPTNGTLFAVSPVEQQISLSNPSAAAPGGRGYMTPQAVIAKDSAGNPLPGVAVTFEVPANGYLTCVMRGYNKNTITVTTDSNGMASAANTHQSFLGEGFQVYSQYSYITQTLQVKATAPGLKAVTFNVKVGTVGYKF